MGGGARGAMAPPKFLLRSQHGQMLVTITFLFLKGTSDITACQCLALLSTVFYGGGLFSGQESHIFGWWSPKRKQLMQSHAFKKIFVCVHVNRLF